ncbi:lysozyme inhibitor LprI family protein [Methylobacterium sp. CM6247]
MKKALTVFVLVLLTVPALAERKSAGEDLKQIESYCYKSNASMAEGRNCLAKQAERIRRDVEKSARKRHFEIDEVAKRVPADGGMNGKEDAERWRAAFTKEQQAWNEYEKQRCDNVVNFENAGGSGAGGKATACSIRLMLERIRELEDGY